MRRIFPDIGNIPLQETLRLLGASIDSRSPDFYPPTKQNKPPQLQNIELGMIKRASELLQKVIEAENNCLKKYKLTHPPTIGAMYEGFTKKWLDKVLPLQSPLDVSSGFIADEHGSLSNELDCMIVTAEGENIPHTDKRKFKVDDVVAVIQVKKNLYSDGIEAGYQNLRSVLRFPPSRLKNTVLFTDAFQSITRCPLPRREDVKNLPFEIQNIYHSLLTNFTAPARILLGYNGFKSHRKFRQSFVDYLFVSS